MLLHIGRIGLSVDGERIVARLMELGAYLKEILDGFAASGDIFFHGVDERLLPAGKGRVDLGLSVAGCGDDAEILRDYMPLEIYAKIIHDRLTACAEFLRCTPLTQFMESRLKFETPPPEAGSTAAREIVAFNKQCLLARERHPASCSQAAVAGADDHSIIFWHNAFPPFHIFFALIKYLWQYFNPINVQLQENCQYFII